MPTEARGNYLPEPPYLRETQTYHSQPLESTRHAGNYFVPLSIRPIYVKLLGYRRRAEKISLLPEAPLWHEARGICHICHMVNAALITNQSESGDGETTQCGLSLSLALTCQSSHQSSRTFNGKCRLVLTCKR